MAIDFKDYKKAASELESFLNTTNEFHDLIGKERVSRASPFDIATMRQQKQILEDETWFPMRVCDDTIKRQQPEYIKYLTGRRLVLIRDAKNPDTSVKDIEDNYNRGMRYDNWLECYARTSDGAQAHGLDFVEIKFDKDKPLLLSIEHIGASDFYFPWQLRSNLESAPLLARRIPMTSTDLDKAVKDQGFNANVVAKMRESKKDTKDLDTYDCYKIWYKENGLVFVCWYTKYPAGEEWLKDPAPLVMGYKVRNPAYFAYKMQMQQYQQAQQLFPGVAPVMPPPTPVEEFLSTQLDFYPIEYLSYTVTEQELMASQRGVVFQYTPIQEAITALWVAGVNGTIRASGLYAYRKPAPGVDPVAGAGKYESVALKHGGIFNQELGFFNPPYPDQGVFTAASALQSQQLQSTGNLNWAVAAKGGKTRPTATEVNQSTEEDSQLNSVVIAMFGMFIQRLHTKCYKLVKSYAQQNLVYLCGDRPLSVMDPATYEEKDIYQNDQVVLAKKQYVMPAGDIDVIARQQKIQGMMQLWGLVSNTPIAGEVLKKLMILMFPEGDGESMAAMLDQPDPRLLVSALLQLVENDTSYTQDESPERILQLQNLIQTARQYVGTTNKPTEQGGNSSSSPQTMAIQSSNGGPSPMAGQ